MVFKPILTEREVKQIAIEFKKALKKAGIKANKLILFGSYARRMPHPWSDVDFCVVSDQFGKREYDEMVKLSKIGKRVNYLIEAHPMNSNDLKQGVHPLAEEIKKTGRLI